MTAVSFKPAAQAIGPFGVAVLRNLAQIIVTLLAASFVIFAAMYLAPGDTAAMLAGGPDNLTPANLAAINEQYHLDDPFIVQYGYWLAHVVTGDLGRSYVTRQPVVAMIVSRSDVTAGLVLYASAVVIVVGVILGVLSAVRRGWFDSLTVAVTTFLGGLPPFVAGVALIALLAGPSGLFPAFGAGDGIVDSIYHLTLPSLALATASVAGLTRITRQSMIDHSEAEHALVAETRGLPPGYIIRQHLFRNALAPIITMSGLVVAGMISGTVIVERVFGLSGVGSLLVTSIDDHDLPVTQAVLLLLVAAYVITTRFADVFQRFADPRLKVA